MRGEFVIDRRGRRGRILKVHADFSQTEEGVSWLRMQTDPITDAEVQQPWCSVLVHDGGSILTPVGRLIAIDPLPTFNNRYYHKRFNAKLYWSRVREVVKVRPYAMHWLEEYAKVHYAPSGSGHKRDRKAFAAEFC